MPEIEKSATIRIKRNLAEVFSFVADPGKFKLWQPFVIDAEITSPGPIGKGTTYRYTFKAMRNVIETSGIITEYQTLRMYSYKSTSGPFPIYGGFRFQEVDDFIEVTAFGGADTMGHFPLQKFMIGMLLERQLRTTLQTLKEVLEGTG
ncbi:SRPBCC family protein [Thermodesulfobacteriota bacterium]